MKYIAHIITFIRLLTVPCIFHFLRSNAYLYAFFLFLVALITDVVDGFIARRFNAVSLFGQYFDAFVDKALMSGVLLAILLNAVSSVHMPSMVVNACMLLLIKEIILLCVASLMWMFGRLMIVPSMFARAVSFVESIFLLSCICFMAITATPPLFLMIQAYMNILLSCCLLLWYAYVLIRANI